MSTNRLTRAIALTAGGLLLAGGAAVATAGTASATPTHAPVSYSSHDDGHDWGYNHDHGRGYGDYYDYGDYYGYGLGGYVIIIGLGGY